MPAYIQGNLAVEQPKNAPRERVKLKETKKMVYRNRTLPTQEKLLYLFTVAVLVMVAGVIVWRYALIYQMNASIMQIQKDMRQMQAENMSLKQQIDELQSPKRLQEEAQKLGMGPRDDADTQPADAKSAVAKQTNATASAQRQIKQPAEAKKTQPANGAKVALNR